MRLVVLSSFPVPFSTFTAVKILSAITAFRFPFLEGCSVTIGVFSASSLVEIEVITSSLSAKVTL